MLVYIPYGNEVILLNQQATPTLDAIAQFITNLGLGGIFVIPIVITLFTRYYYAITAIVIFILTGILTFAFKQLLFHGLPRPMYFLGTEAFEHLIPGFHYHSTNTFPSGHTITAFSLALFAAITIKNKYWNLLFLGVAVLIGISRVYLLQHFFVDVFVGSILGLFATLSGFYLTKTIFRKNPVIMNHCLVFNGKVKSREPKLKPVYGNPKPQRVLPLTFSSAFFFKSS